MRSLSQVFSKQYDSGVLGLTGAAPQVADGKTFITGLAARGSLSAEIDYDILTNTITFTATWQVSVDGTNWVACRPSNAAADVAFATGTGAQVAGKVVLSAPDIVYGYRYCRLIVTTGTGVGQGAGKDDVDISYSYVKSSNGS